MVNKEKYVGESKLMETSNRPLRFKLKEKSVKTQHLDDASVTLEKIDPDLIQQIEETLSGDITEIQSKIPAEASAENKLVDRASLTAEEERATQAERDISEALDAEEQRATEAEQTNSNAIAAEVTRATDIESGLRSDLTSEVARAMATEEANALGISDINAKIPSAASSSNQLADKDFVNSSVATNTANYISNGGEPFSSYSELISYPGQKTNNDYAFVRTTDAAGSIVYKRYKYIAASNSWAFEYELNNSSFTAAQWATINSLLTSAHKTKLDALPTNAELTTLFAGKQDVISDIVLIRSQAASAAPQSTTYTKAEVNTYLNGKQDSISDLDSIRNGASKGATSYQKPSSGIPKTDLSSSVQESLNKADTAIQSLADYYNKSQVDTFLNGKQDVLTIDSTPTMNSNNPISSDAVYDLQQATITALNGKQAALTFDNLPTAGSANPVTSGGIYTAIVNSSGVSFIEVDTLPAPGVSTVGAVYVLKQDDNIFEWYVTIYDQYAVPPEYKWRLVNTNSIDFSEFYTKTETDATFAKKSEMSVTPGTGANVDKTTIQLKNGLSTTVLTQHQDISGKQDVLTFATEAECESAAEELT